MRNSQISPKNLGIKNPPRNRAHLIASSKQGFHPGIVAEFGFVQLQPESLGALPIGDEFGF